MLPGRPPPSARHASAPVHGPRCVAWTSPRPRPRKPRLRNDPPRVAGHFGRAGMLRVLWILCGPYPGPAPTGRFVEDVAGLFLGGWAWGGFAQRRARARPRPHPPIHPGGMAACSRWLSEGTPPEPKSHAAIDPERGRSRSRQGPRRVQTVNVEVGPRGTFDRPPAPITRNGMRWIVRNSSSLSPTPPRGSPRRFSCSNPKVV